MSTFVDVAVDLLEQPVGLGVRRHVLEALDLRHVQAAAEVVVARHAAAPGADDVDHRQVDDLAAPLEVAERLGEVVQRDRAGMGDAERIERVAEPGLTHRVVGHVALDLEELLPAAAPPVEKS